MESIYFENWQFNAFLLKFIVIFFLFAQAHTIRRKRKNGELSLAEKVKKEEEEEQGEKRPRFSDSSKKIDGKLI